MVFVYESAAKSKGKKNKYTCIEQNESQKKTHTHTNAYNTGT